MEPQTWAIKAATAHHYGFKVSDIMGKRKTMSLSRARHVAMYLCKKHTGKSYAEIGRIFNRDHSSVMYGCERIRARIEALPHWAAVDVIERELCVWKEEP